MLFFLKQQNQSDWREKLKAYLFNRVQAALVIRGLFICDFTYSHFKNDPKWQFSSQKWTFYL
jgi:hypothetical protein